MNKNKDHLTLIIALALPVLFIIVMSAYLYLPSLFVKPQINFIYYQPDGTRNSVSYKVINNNLIYEAPRRYGDEEIPTFLDYEWPEIYLYDIVTDQSQTISFEQAQNMILSVNEKSSDGFEIINGSGSGDFSFGYSSGDYYSRYLKKNGYSKKLNIGSNYFNFIGWVAK